jgi:cysteinyl-tRNA synthetase, unknown class
MGLRACPVFGICCLVIATTAAGCSSDDDDDDNGDGGNEQDDPSSTEPGLGPGIPTRGPWTSFYGTAAEMGDLGKVADTFRIINIDADPETKNFTDAEIATLRAGGKNRVISYLDVGSCEDFRSYWADAPGFVSCSANKAAQLGPYEGYPDEIWMDPSNADYQRLIVDYVAARLVKRGVDGFYLDNLELLGHEPDEANGPCSAACRQGGLDLVRKLREKFPDRIIVMQNGTSDVTRLGKTGGIEYRRLLDGIAHEEIYAPTYDADAEEELLAWQKMNLRSKGGDPFAILVEDYVGGCDNASAAVSAIDRSTARGFSAYVSDASEGQRVVCYWGKP